METFKMSDGKLLRRGYTTGSCAAAAAKAALTILIEQSVCHAVTLETPAGLSVTLDVLNPRFTPKTASCAVQKDSGDEPDITNGVLVYATVSYADGFSGIRVSGGEGIGRVTKPGLDRPVGEHAINSVPRRMIAEECERLLQNSGYNGGLSVIISVPGGEALALRTFNPRLGITGGLSILGTTGIVEPMSETAFADAIRAELNLLYAAGERELLLTIGNYGEKFARDKLNLPLNSCIQCSNFIGETLAAAAEKGFKRALIIGHIGKLVKLGLGIMNTHSRHGDGRIELLVSLALESGADLLLLKEISRCVTADAVIPLLRKAGLSDKVTQLLKQRIADTLSRHIAPCLKVDFICFTGLGESAELLF